MPPAPVARRKPALSPLRARRALAARLKDFRAWLGLTQQALAGAAGVTRATIARWEAGISPLPAWLAGLLLDHWRGPKDQDLAALARLGVRLAKGRPCHDMIGLAIRAKDQDGFLAMGRALGVWISP